ncbi:MAG TPA: L,D-transpeptidase family protein [Solirubrobacteraceae bacterium]|nr:L,D-transpeptidase family protein [Solirubrobacteraceae bacterium]
MRRALALAAALALLAPAGAAAQDPPPPEPAPAPPVPTLTLVAKNVLRAGGEQVALQRQAFRVHGTMTPAVAGQRVALVVYRDGKPHRTVSVAAAGNGTFSHRLPAARPGRIAIIPAHVATPELGGAFGPRVSVTVVPRRASEGARGLLVRLLQRGLAKLRYAVSRSGRFDSATGRAVMAFRKVNKMSRGYDADRRVIRKVLAGEGAFKPRHPGAGHHVEADISRQVLALVDGHRVVATYHTSTGAPATPTVIGSFRVYLKTPGTNAKGMVHSSYFIRGYAIHGYIDVPAFNASHGCLRVPIPDAWRVFTWIRHGERVIVYP